MTRFILNLVDPLRRGDFLARAKERWQDDTWGFTERHRQRSAGVVAGSLLICLLTEQSKWCGVLRVTGGVFSPDDPRAALDDRLTVCFPVERIVVLPAERAIDVFSPHVWPYLDRTKGVEPRAHGWNTKARLWPDMRDLGEADGKVLAVRLLAEIQQAKLSGAEKVVDSDLIDDPTYSDRTWHEALSRPEQAEFRNKLMRAYEQRCAISDCGVAEALQAAHIVPWREPSTSNRITNGLLLRADLHVLFDKHLFEVQPTDLSIVVSERLRDSDYERFHGRTLRVPDGAREGVREALRHRARMRVSTTAVNSTPF